MIRSALITWTAAAALLLSTSTVPAQKAGPELRELTRDRLLTLNSGQIVRGSARWRDGRWELRRKGSWQAVVGPVSEVRLERDVLADARQRLGGLARGDLAGRVELAARLLTTGLHTEGLELLDDVLAVEADHEAALSLLEQPDMPVMVPSWSPLGDDPAAARRALIDYGARCNLPLQELVIDELVAAGTLDRNGLAADLERALVTPAPGGRAFAALALRRLFPGRALNPLLKRSLLDPAKNVRKASCLALRDADDERLGPYLATVLDNESSVVRTHAATALGWLGQPAAVAPLARHLQTLAPPSGGGSSPRSHIYVGRQISYIQDFEPEVATGAVIAAPVIGIIQEGTVLDVRVHGAGGGGGIGYEFSTETRELRAAMRRLTGARVTDTNSAWKRWWRTSGEAWLAEQTAAATPLAPSDPEHG